MIKQSEYTNAWARGFVKACEAKGIDPEKLLKSAQKQGSHFTTLQEVAAQGEFANLSGPAASPRQDPANLFGPTASPRQDPAALLARRNPTTKFEQGVFPGMESTQNPARAAGKGIMAGFKRSPRALGGMAGSLAALGGGIYGEQNGMDPDASAALRIGGGAGAAGSLMSAVARGSSAHSIFGNMERPSYLGAMGQLAHGKSLYTGDMAKGMGRAFGKTMHGRLGALAALAAPVLAGGYAGYKA